MVCDLASLRHDTHFVDAEFYVDGVTFRAHRALLSSASQYFRALFRRDMREGMLGNGPETTLGFCFFIEKISKHTNALS